MAMILAALLLSATIAPASADQSAAAQQITNARLALVREQLPLALALPVDIDETDEMKAARVRDSDCPEPYATYRGELDAFAKQVVNPMHTRNDPVEARKNFDHDYLCAARQARRADPEWFQVSMAKKLAVLDAQLSSLGQVERRQLVEQLIAQRGLEKERLGAARVDKSVKSAMDIIARLEKSTLNSHDLDELSSQVNPGAGATRLARDWLNNPVYAREFKYEPPQYRSLTIQSVPAALPSQAPAPVTASRLADFISSVAQVSRGYTRRVQAYVQKISNAIVNSSAARSIDARLSTAIVWAESNFHYKAQSFADCVGLGQLSRGVADAYRVTNREDVNQNVRATTGYLRDLIKQFATTQDQLQLQAAFAAKADEVQKAVAAGQPKQQAIDRAFSDLWPRIPYHMKNAVAAYNAGPNAILRVGGWDRLPLPRNGCAYRPARDNSYCQTTKYVPRVLKNYFTVFVETSDRSPEIFASNKFPDPQLQTITVSAQYRPATGL